MILSRKQPLLIAALAMSVALPALAQDSRPPAGQTVQGTVESVTPKTLTLKTRRGEVSVAILAPLTVYTERPSHLSQVKDSAFVGITSVKRPDGTQVATEVHIFPEALRGMGEGSYMMNDAAGKRSANRMTNGSVESARMTNGSVSKQSGGQGRGRAVTVNYGAGSEAITLPPGVPVTEIVAIKGGLAAGENVFVLAAKTGNGALATRKVLLMTPRK